MAENIYTFYPSFKEFLPLYRNVTRVWIGNGINTGASGMLYAEYADGNVAEIGSVSLYATAREKGYTGTEDQWVQMIMSVATLVTGSQVSISYIVSADGTAHPEPSADWQPTPSFEQGKYTWAKLDLTWIDGNTTTVYFASYQGVDGSVQSVNGAIGDIFLHGENLQIGEELEQSIKDYIDENDIPNTATDEDIDALFSMAFFSGAAFITGRRFTEGDAITYEIEAITEGAPLPNDTSLTIHPLGGNSWPFSFGNVLYGTEDIPTGETQKTFTYQVKETSHVLDGVPASATSHIISVTIYDNGDGTVKIERSENFNKLYFVYKYTAEGRIIFEGTMKLNGRTMGQHEFNVEIMEGDKLIASGISSVVSASTGQAVPIVYPPINYTIDDIGTHVYTVKQTNVSGNGLTIDTTVHTVTVYVRDDYYEGNNYDIPGELEITTDGTDKDVSFVNTYEAFGTVTFYGNQRLVYRKFRDEDSLRISVTSISKLPSPASVDVAFEVGTDNVDFVFPTIQYSLIDMVNPSGGYYDSRTFEYTVITNGETPNIKGVTKDGLTHTISVNIVDDKLGHLIATPTYSDGEKVQFIGTYSAYGTLTILGEKKLLCGNKRLENRKFIVGDTMYVTITSTDGGTLPYYHNGVNVPLTAGQTKVDFNFMEITYNYFDLQDNPEYTYHYLVTEDTSITGADNDALTHSLAVYLADNYDGTLTVTPTYSDGSKLSFTSIYNATGAISLVGSKAIVNRVFKDNDRMNVLITDNDGGNLPNPADISVTLTSGSNNASFSYAPITYSIDDLNGDATKTFNYTVTETVNMDGTTPESVSDTLSVIVTDTNLGTLTVEPVYTNGSNISLTNVYAADTYLGFKARCVFTNGNMANNPFTVRITQVTGDGSTTQATENVVLSAPSEMIANTGSSQDLVFNNIVHYVKNSLRDDTQHSYWFMIEQVLPEIDSQNLFDNVVYDISKKWINVNVRDNFDGTLTATKNPSNDIDMTFTNEQLADLTIGKIWTGDEDRLTTAEKNVFTFIVTGPNSYNVSFTYADMTENAKTLEHLKIGEYTVVETNNTVENFIITTSYSVGGTNTNQISLIRGGGRVNVTDNVNKLEGTLNIVKVWSGEHNLLTAEQKNAVVFTVSGPKQKSTDLNPFSQTFTYADMSEGRKTFERLTLGTYTVVESNSEMTDFDVVVSYSANGVPVNYTNIADADNKTITIDGAYTLHRGTAKVTKDFTGIPSLPAGYTITNNYDSSVFVFNNADNADVADGFNIPFVWTIKNIPVHTTVQFTENNAEVTNYTLEASAIPANRTCSAITKNETSTVTLSNNYILHRGTVKVAKQFVGITALQKPANFSITNSYDDSIFTYENADNTGVADGITVPYEWTIPEVPVTTTISFTEHNIDIADYSVVATAIPTNYTCAAVVKDQTSTVAITNTYTIHKGYARLTAKFSGITSAQKPADFSISNDYNASVFTFANADNALSADGITIPYEWTIANVPVHTVITFTENNSSIVDYDMTAVTSKTSSEIIKDTTTVVDFVNTYEIHTGAIIITALFSGISTLPAGFNITNDYNSDVFTYDNANPGGDGFHISYKWTLTNVPVHTVITFTENNTGMVDYDLTSPTVKTSAEVPHDNTTDVHFVNTYVYHTGSVRVIKQFNGLTTLPISYSITNDYNSDVFVYANADNAATADGITIPYQWTLTNVPVHAEVKFTENNAEVTDYTLTGSASPANYTCLPVVKDGTQTVTMTNSYVYHTGSVKVTKQFSGITAGQEPSSFQIVNDYNDDVFTYANAVNVADGVVVPYEWVINNIPVHTNITFTESNEGVTDYSLTPASIKVRQSGSIVKDTEATVDYVNEYTYDTGYIRIYAAFSGTATNPSNFRITNNYNSDVFTLENGTWTGGALGYYWAIHDVPVHTVVQFTQANYDVDGYTCSHDTLVKSCYEIHKDTPSNVYFVNTYTRDTGSIKVSKLFTGIETLPSAFNITNNYNDSIFTYDNADNALTADGITTPYEWTINNIPTGTIVTFTEHDYDVSGYALSEYSNTTINSYAVVKDTTVNVDFINMYNSIITLINRTFTFNSGLTSASSVEVGANNGVVLFRDADDTAYSALKLTAGDLSFFDTVSPHWESIGGYPTITFKSNPTTFTTGVTTLAEFETWLLTVATEQT